MFIMTVVHSSDQYDIACTLASQNKVNGSTFNLEGLGFKYWLNPNQVLASSGFGFNLADAESICLDSCPAVRTASGCLFAAFSFVVAATGV